MNSPDAFEGPAPRRGQVFRYEGFTADAGRGLLTCRYSLDGREFAERVSLTPGPGWDTPAARAAARIVYLLAGVSYYKTAAPPVIDLGDTALTERERVFLREFYLSGLGEYAYRNGLDLSGLRIVARSPSADPVVVTLSRLQPDRCHHQPRRAAPRPPRPRARRFSICGRLSPSAAASTRS